MPRVHKARWWGLGLFTCRGGGGNGDPGTGAVYFALDGLRLPGARQGKSRACFVTSSCSLWGAGTALHCCIAFPSLHPPHLWEQLCLPSVFAKLGRVSLSLASGPFVAPGMLCPLTAGLPCQTPSLQPNHGLAAALHSAQQPPNLVRQTQNLLTTCPGLPQ